VQLDTAFAELFTHDAVEGHARKVAERGGWSVVNREIKNADSGSGVLHLARRDQYTGRLSGHTLFHYGCPEARDLFERRLVQWLSLQDKVTRNQ